MSVGDYYETYWTPSGWNPAEGSGLDPKVERLYRSEVQPHFRCLDLGCGNGRTSGLWLTAHASEYIGVDISSTGVAKALEAGLDARTIDDAAQLPFPDASFDFVACIEVLEHLFRPDEAAHEAARVLVPGGVMVVTVPNVCYWRRRTDSLLGRWNPYGDDRSVEEPWRDPHIRFFTASALRRMLLGCGFDQVRIGGHGGAFLRELPPVRRLGANGASRSYGFAEGVLPGLLGARLHARATRKP